MGDFVYFLQKEWSAVEMPGQRFGEGGGNSGNTGSGLSMVLTQPDFERICKSVALFIKYFQFSFYQAHGRTALPGPHPSPEWDHETVLANKL